MSTRKASTYFEQVRRAMNFEDKLEAILVDTFRKHNKWYFRFEHIGTKTIWDVTLSKLENYGHNKFSRLNKGNLMGSLLTRQDAIIGFLKIHGDTYDYSNMEYINGNTKVEIICDVHGSFSQKPRMHKSGQGCPTCAKALDGWSYTAWESKGLSSKNFDSFKVYIIECYDDKETFYKIGRTFTTLDKRFVVKGNLPYKFKVISIIEGEARVMAELEVKLQNIHAEHKYIPTKHFDGKYECFSEFKEETIEDYTK